MSEQPVRIAISHVYSSNNNGDAAILSAQISELRRVFAHPILNILSVDVIDADYTFDDVSVANSLMFGAVQPGRSKLRKLLFSAGMIGYTTLWALVYRLSRRFLPVPRTWRRPLHILAEADMQVCVGGGYLRAKDDFVSTIMLTLLFHQIWLTKLLNKPVYLYAQSFGPYPRRLQRAIAVAGLKRADLILVREAKSKALLDSFGLRDERVIQVPDSAFLFRPANKLAVDKLLGPKKPQEKFVGITVRAWLQPAAQRRYEAAMATFIERLQRQPQLHVIVIPQVTSEQQDDDDREVGKRLRSLLRPSENLTILDERFSHYDIKSIFACLDYLVGTRFHSVIFALTAGVPALAIEYEHKTSGIMQDLGLDEWVVPIEAVTADGLSELFERLVQERAAYLGQLHKVLPDYMAQAHESSERIRQAYEQRHADAATKQRR